LAAVTRRQENEMTAEGVTTASAPATSRLYKYVDLAGLGWILDGSIRFTQPSAFNDPFELLPEIVMPANEPERKISIRFDILGKRRYPPVGEVDTVPDGYRSGDPTSRDIVQQLNSLVGICCLSRTSDSLVMWSHYADQYGGAVVEFDASHNFFAHPIDIEYRALRPKKDLSDYLAGEPIPVSELCVKSDQWAHESEVRIVRCLTDCEDIGKVDPRGFSIYTQTLPIEAIKSVTVGERMSIEAQREIFARVMNTNIGLALAAIDLSGYGFRREIIKYPVPISKMGPWMSPRTAHIFRELNSDRGAIARHLIEKHPMSRMVNKPVRRCP
jgi:hypothetical protein